MSLPKKMNSLAYIISLKLLKKLEKIQGYQKLILPHACAQNAMLPSPRGKISS